MSAAEIAANNRVFEKAIATGNVAAIAVLLAPDVIALPPNGPIVTGREAVAQLWASAIRE
jgi:ketosteroid isomerase-like protein